MGDRAPGHRFSRRWWFGPGSPIAVGYTCAAAGLAADGVITARSWPILLAVLLTLPLGLAALVGSYLGYAVLKGVGGLFATTESTAGDQAAWLTVLSGLVIVGLVLAAAVGNLVLLSRSLAGRRRSGGSYSTGGEVGPGS